MLGRTVWLAGAMTVLLCAAAEAQSAPGAPSPELLPGLPTPTPSASPQPDPHEKRPASRFGYTVEATTTYANQQFVGPGTVPPEAPLFLGGSPIAPGTPYDYWTSSPTVTGYGAVQTLQVTPHYELSPAYEIGATFGEGVIAGTGNVAAYWGDQPLPTLNPHLGLRAVSVPPAFPTANGQDPMGTVRTSVLSGAIGRHDGSLVLRGGWFDLAQTEPFVFQQPPQTNAPIAFTEPLPEGLGDGPQLFDLFGAGRTSLPLHGVDLLMRPSRRASIELTDAELPQPPGTQARMVGASLEIDEDHGVSYAAQIARVVTGGQPVVATTLFGNTPTVVPSAQGPLPISLLNGQTMMLGGLRASFPIGRTVGVELRAATSCYGADGTAVAREHCTSGQYYDALLRHAFGGVDVTLEGRRFEATYAPMILPYGTSENVWSIAYSWPGEWLKGDYQFVDNGTLGANREGARLSARFTALGVETRLAYSEFRQILPYDTANAYEPGFVEGYYLPQLTAAGGTLGKEQHAAATFTAHPRFADVELDLTDVTMSRPGSPGHPGEAVAMNYPAGTLTLSRAFGPVLRGTLGAGRYAAYGAWVTAGPPNADLAESVLFAGLAFQESPASALAFQYRLYAVNGLPTVPQGTSPAYHGPQFLIEQRFRR
ncbi:MAG TPA: hypothetical protein VMA36_05590 [Candidatus Limnocylindria bacterium]|nr:hypothetical protein [Candidatus Limnocylindria bacterium]